MKPARYLPLMLGASVLAILVFLYVKAQAVDLRRYGEVTEAMSTLQRLDAEVGQEVLRIRQGLVGHYDRLTAKLKEIGAAVRRLEEGLGKLGRPGGGLHGQLVMIRRSERKLAQGINDYITQNALVRNSENYLPGELRSLLNELRPRDLELAGYIGDVLEDNLVLYMLRGDTAARERVQEAITELWGRGQTLDEVTAARLANILSHASLLVERKALVEKAVEDMLAMDLSRQVGMLLDSYQGHHLVQQRRAGFYRMVLFTLSAVLLGYLVYLLFRLARTTRALRRSLDAMEQTQEVLRVQASALEAAANAIVITSPEGRILWVNKAFTRLTGYSMADVVGKRPSVLKSGVQDERTYRELWETILDGRVWFGEMVNRRKDGSLYVEEETITPVQDERGQITHFIAIKHDITERRHTERSLRRANRALRVLSDANQALVRATTEQQLLDEICRIIVNVGGYLLVWIGQAMHDEEKNVRVVARAGEGEDYVRSLRVRWDDSEYGRGPTGRAIRTCQPVVMKDTARDPDYAPWRQAAGRCGFRSSVALPLGTGGECWGVLNIYSANVDAFDSEELELLKELADDIQFGVHVLRSNDERRMLRRQLQQAQKMEAIGQLTGGIAHDFNNILASIMGYTGLALNRFGDNSDPKLVDYLNEVYRAGERARDLIAQMLAFSRSGTGETRPLSLAPVIKEAVKLLESTLPASVEVHLDVEHEIPDVRIDPVQLHQIIMNLCINARDAMEGHGRIDMGMRHARCAGSGHEGCICASCHQGFEGDYVELVVANDGPTIPPEMLEHIFEPFYTTKEVGKGTGMGLSMVHGIVHEHGGHIRVDCGETRGVAFRIFLPADSGSESSSPVEERFFTAHALACGRVLVVDDEEAVGGFMAELLETHGYEVVTETNGAEALELFKAAPQGFDLVITDQTMPGLTGGELAAELLRLRPDLPIVLCTGYSEHMDEQRALEIGIRAYLPKPVAAGTLLDTVAKLLTANTRDDELR